MLPNWLHIGAAKCASSWLWRVCIEHPEICVPTEHRPDVEELQGMLNRDLSHWLV